jgi:hypothetical protein
MAISGYIAAGAQEALDQVLQRRLQEQERRAQEQQRAAAIQMQREQMDMQRQQQADIQADRVAAREHQQKVFDLADLTRREQAGERATQKNVLSDMAGVLAMPGMSNQAKAAEMMGPAIRTGQVDPLKVIEGLTRVPDVKRHAVTVNVGGKPVRRLATEDELAQGVEEYREPKSAEKPSYIQVVGPDGTMQMMTAEEIRAKGGVPTTKGNAADPVQAAETRQNILNAAKDLKDSVGVSEMTGARGMAYGFGLAGDKPLPGTKAASARARFDTLKSLLTLPNLGMLKGAMSDKDLAFIQSAGSALSPDMDDATFTNELNTIIKKLEGGSGTSPVPSAGSGGELRVVKDPKTGKWITVGGG